MAGCVGKLYVAHCPSCNAVVKEISPVPFCRCRVCNKLLLVQINTWKLEDSVCNEQDVAERPEDGSVYGNHGEVNKVERWKIEKHLNSSDEKLQEGSDAQCINKELSNLLDSAGCLFTAQDGNLSNQCTSNEAGVNARACERSVSNDECLSLIKEKPVSRRTFRARKTCTPMDTLPDSEEGKLVLADKNIDMDSRTSDQEENFTSPSSSDSDLTAECIFSLGKHELSLEKDILTSNLDNTALNVASDICQVKNALETQVPTHRSLDAYQPSTETETDSASAFNTKELIVHCIDVCQQDNSTSTYEDEELIVYGAVNSRRINLPFNDIMPISNHREIEAEDRAVDKLTEQPFTDRRNVNPSHLELLRKLDEMKLEIIRSMGQPKIRNNPRNTNIATQITQKYPVSQNDSEQLQQQLFKHRQPRKATQSDESLLLGKSDPCSRYQLEHDREVNQTSLSGSSTSGSLSPRVSVGPQRYSSWNPSHHGNGKVRCELRELLNIDRCSSDLRHCRPYHGSTPFVVCYKCLELLQLPEDFQLAKRHKKLQCGACFKFLKLMLVEGTHIVPSPHD